MNHCPKCDELLIPTREAGDPQWICPQCRARLVPISALERRLSAELARTLRARIAEPVARSGPLCAKCTRPMRRLALEHGSDRIVVDACRECDLVLLERGELERLPRKQRYEAADPAAMQRELAKQQVRLEFDRHRRQAVLQDLSWPRRVLSWIGLPVDVDAPESGITPGTWTIAALLVVVFLIELGDPEVVALELAWIPAQPLRLCGLTIFTSFLVHLGWMHLLGNLYFLIVFGRGVETRVGLLRLLVLLAAATVAGNLMHSLFDPRANVPCMGASGGLSALVLYYAATWPKNRFVVTFWFLVRPITFDVSALVWALFWFLWQLAVSLLQQQGIGSVSALSHFGGALAGLAFFLLWRRRDAASAGLGRSSDRSAGPGS